MSIIKQVLVTYLYLNELKTGRKQKNNTIQSIKAQDHYNLNGNYHI